MRITLRNRTVASDVDFELIMEPSSTFELVGVERLTLSLGAGKEITIPFEALIPRPGVHNLQTLKLNIKNQDDAANPQVYKFSLQWLVTVTDESNE
jgi:hypothetical protein